MKWFLIEAALVIFLLSIIFSLVFTYIRIDNDIPLPANFSDHLPIIWKGFYLSIPASLLINCTACGIKFYQEHGKIERDHILLQQAHLENQLKLLQDQINPHVMFNILNHIHILMKSNTELASFLLLKFSDILRYQLYHCNQNQVILDKEIQYLQDLVEVEKLRWGNELDVKAEWNIHNKRLLLLRFSLFLLLKMPLNTSAAFRDIRVILSYPVKRKTIRFSFMLKILIRIWRSVRKKKAE